VAIPTRRRGLVRKRRGPKALVDENCRTATNNNNTARASALATPNDEAGLVYQVDFFGPKHLDWLRLVSLNLDNLAIEINQSHLHSLYDNLHQMEEVGHLEGREKYYTTVSLSISSTAGLNWWVLHLAAHPGATTCTLLLFPYTKLMYCFYTNPMPAS